MSARVSLELVLSIIAAMWKREQNKIIFHAQVLVLLVLSLVDYQQQK